MTNMESSREVCCGRLFYAEIVSGITVLECCQCGSFWRMAPDGTLAAIARRQGTTELNKRRPKAASLSPRALEPR